MKKTIILTAILLFIGLCKSYGQNNKVNETTSPQQKISFSILRKGGPSWVYKLTSKLATNLEIQVRDAENKLYTSDKISVSGESISKFSVYGLSSNDFYIVILNGETEVYKEKFNKNQPN